VEILLVGLPQTQSGYRGKANSVQHEEQGYEEPAPLHGQIDAVPAVHRQEHFTQAQPGESSTVVFPPPGVRGLFDVEFRRAYKATPNVAEGFQDRPGVAQRNARAEHQ